MKRRFLDSLARSLAPVKNDDDYDEWNAANINRSHEVKAGAHVAAAALRERVNCLYIHVVKNGSFQPKCQGMVYGIECLLNAKSIDGKSELTRRYRGRHLINEFTYPMDEYD